MKVELKGINKVRAKLADGSRATYYYHRATKTRLEGEPGSEAFMKSLAAAENIGRDRTLGTLSGLFRLFKQKSLRWRTKLAESTKGEYQRIFDFWEGKYGTVPYQALEEKAFREDVLAWHAEYAGQYPREADNRVTVLARVLSWGAKDGPIKTNVLDGFERAYEGDRSEKIWLPHHVDAFMEVANDEMKIAMMLALHTGQRQADIRAMAWSNFDGEAIVIRPGKSRGKKVVTIPCTKALKETLDALPRRGALIMPTKTGRAFQKRYFAQLWEETFRATRINEDLHFHDLRGTTVTLLFEAGCTVAEAAAITGHSLKTAQAILDKYLARTRALADRAIAKFENVLALNSAKRAAKGQ